MKLLNVLFFLLAFSVDVRVHAKLIQTPEKCLDTKEYCVLKSEGSKEIVKIDDVVVSLKSDSTLIRQTENYFSFVKGTFLIKTNQKASVDTSYGKVSLDAGAQVIFEKKENVVTIETIFGKSLMHPVGAKKSIYILEGYENYLSEVDNSLKAQVGIPKPIIVDSLLKNWAMLTDSSKKDFVEDVDRFKEVHEKAVKDLSILNDQIVQREIASVTASKKAEIDRVHREKVQKKARQDMYLDHLLGE
jgi:hypothetical protein